MLADTQWSNEDLLLSVVIDVWLYVQHLYQWCVEEAIFIQDVADHPQGSTTQVALLHQIFLSAVKLLFIHYNGIFHSGSHWDLCDIC